MIETNIKKLRDPCVLAENGVYYMYGTDWVCYENTSRNLDGEWKNIGVVVDVPDSATSDYWAPEVHKYNGKYYMFTTYFSSETNMRGCSVMRADKPEGPFVEISDGQITKNLGYYTIDGTFYVDDDGQPWMIFVREWIDSPDKVGGMMAAKLSNDLTKLISEPVELFRANDPEWAAANITDGCWLYKCKNGELIMLWSNLDANGYCVAVARSLNGKVDGKWVHDKNLLYSGADNVYDGGHAMIFTAFDGNKYLSLHSPNVKVGERNEKPVFYNIQENDGKLYLLK